jgi:S1-C subfamily serine protease
MYILWRAPFVSGIKDEWETMINQKTPAIVSIKFIQPKAFDIDDATTAVATGFVVDIKRGIILTNRHVIGGGPFIGTSIA